MSANLCLKSGDAMPDAANIPLLRELHFQRQQLLRARTTLTLQMKAIERRLNGHPSTDTQRSNVSAAGSSIPSISEVETIGSHHLSDSHLSSAPVVSQLTEGTDDSHTLIDTPGVAASSVASLACIPYISAQEPINDVIKLLEKRMRKEARKLPVITWVDTVCGFGEIGLSQIVGEAGDLANYANPAKLWKRFGLHVVNGKSARRSKTNAEEQAYSPVRRAIMFVIGDLLLKKQNPYRELYLQRKAFEQTKVPDGTKMLWHRRAQRYAEKRLLLNLWRAWTGRGAFDTHTKYASALANSEIENPTGLGDLACLSGLRAETSPPGFENPVE